MSRTTHFSIAFAFVVTATSLAIVRGQNQPKQDSERRVKETEVPAAALIALKNLAGGHALTEIEEEIKGSQQIYEAEWRTPGGKRQAAVTDAGDLIELEESIGREAVPRVAAAAAQKVAGDKTPVRWTKKTFVVYEAKFTKDNRHQELLFNAAGLPSGCDDEPESKDTNEGDDQD